MASRAKFARSGLFRLITVFSSGLGAAALSLWATMLARLGDAGSFDINVSTGIIAALATLAGAGCAHAYFAGSDETSKAYEEALAVDSTTGLLSRIGLEQKIADLPKPDNSKRRGFVRWMLVSVEIDAFRDINDAYGLEAGDTVLKTMGERISHLVGKLGPVARIAGSEFAFAIEVSSDDRELQAVMSAVIGEISHPIEAGGTAIPVFCTAGLVELTANNLPVSKALRRTNLARATAKAGGLGNWAIYHPEMTQADSYRKWIESELSQAISNRDFDLVYQPQVDNATGRTAGYEALIRWNHPHKGVIPPSEFISVAEQCGMINAIGSWVVRQACQDAKFFAPDATIAVNVSPKQMDSADFVSTLAAIFKETGVAPERIEIEITENVLICDHDKVRRQFEEIRALGCSIAIDDFGTGYSNLNYLSDLPFSKLKLDRAFVSRIEDRENGGALVSTIVNLARALDVEILAEGVETKSQIVMLNAAGCTLMQGYYFGKPVILDRRETIAA
jgi:diguanylate cyclase (GGDEF)-like protein